MQTRNPPCQLDALPHIPQHRCTTLLSYYCCLVICHYKTESNRSYPNTKKERRAARNKSKRESATLASRPTPPLCRQCCPKRPERHHSNPKTPPQISNPKSPVAAWYQVRGASPPNRPTVTHSCFFSSSTSGPSHRSRAVSRVEHPSPPPATHPSMTVMMNCNLSLR